MVRMRCMGRPHDGHTHPAGRAGMTSVGVGGIVKVAVAVRTEAVVGCGSKTARACARRCRLPTRKSPYYRTFTNPFGKTCARKRWMKVATGNVRCCVWRVAASVYRKVIWPFATCSIRLLLRAMRKM